MIQLDQERIDQFNAKLQTAIDKDEIVITKGTIWDPKEPKSVCSMCKCVWEKKFMDGREWCPDCAEEK